MDCEKLCPEPVNFILFLTKRFINKCISAKYFFTTVLLNRKISNFQITASIFFPILKNNR